MFCLHIKESCYIFRFQWLYYVLQVIRYYIHQYETYMFKKLMKLFSMNCLYASHIHKDYYVYHAFMHTVKFSCHASLTEQSGLLKLQEYSIVQLRVSAWRNKYICM
jgi:hypothetical protein